MFNTNTSNTFTPITVSGGYGVNGKITFALSGNTLPVGLSFSNSNGAITGTVSNVYVSNTFTITANDDSFQSASNTFTLRVDAGSLGTILSESTKTLALDTATNFIAVTTTGGVGIISFALSGNTLPSGLTFETSNGAIIGTPTVLLTGNTYTITASDSASNTSAQTFVLIVEQPVFKYQLADGGWITDASPLASPISLATVSQTGSPTTNNSPTISTDTPATANAYSLNTVFTKLFYTGTNTGYFLNTAPNPAYTLGNSDFTVEAWVKLTNSTFGREQLLVRKGTLWDYDMEGGDPATATEFTTSNSTAIVRLSEYGYRNAQFDPFFNVDAFDNYDVATYSGKWMHFALVFKANTTGTTISGTNDVDAGTVTLFFDGRPYYTELVPYAYGSGTIQVTDPSLYNIDFGGNTGFNFAQTLGKIYKLKISNKVVYPVNEYFIPTPGYGVDSNTLFFLDVADSSNNYYTNANNYTSQIKFVDFAANTIVTIESNGEDSLANTITLSADIPSGGNISSNSAQTTANGIGFGWQILNYNVYNVYSQNWTVESWFKWSTSNFANTQQQGTLSQSLGQFDLATSSTTGANANGVMSLTIYDLITEAGSNKGKTYTMEGISYNYETADNAWHHLAFVYEYPNLWVYIDGQPRSNVITNKQDINLSTGVRTTNNSINQENTRMDIDTEFLRVGIFPGNIYKYRFSNTAVYAGNTSFTPSAAYGVTSNTLFMLGTREYRNYNV